MDKKKAKMRKLQNSDAPYELLVYQKKALDISESVPQRVDQGRYSYPTTRINGDRIELVDDDGDYLLAKGLGAYWKSLGTQLEVNEWACLLSHHK